jgi:hypothetical protein
VIDYLGNSALYFEQTESHKILAASGINPNPVSIFLIAMALLDLLVEECAIDGQIVKMATTWLTRSRAYCSFRM